MQKLPLCFIVLGVSVAALALIVGFQVFPMLLRKKVLEKQGRLVNGTDKWASWKEVPIPVFQKIYMFNVTNPEEVYKGEKPNLQELGPYVYQQKRSKVGISVNEENDTVSYRHHDTYFFREDLSNGQLTDRITVLNMPFLGTAAKSMQMGTAARYVVAEMFSEDFTDEKIYVHITVNEFLFGGYFVPFMKDLSELKGEALLPNNTFGLYYGRNGSESLEYEVMTGVKYPEKFGQVVAYDGKTRLGFREEERCDQVIGHDGPTMTPFLTKDREFYLFIPGFCRNMKFAYESDIVMLGLNAYRFTVPDNYLADVETNPDNKCYCSDPGNDYENCLKGGAWELSACKQGTPIVMSFPHFYKGPQEYRDEFVGLNPEQKRHEMVITMEPTSAASLQVAVRVQMNFALKPNKYFKQLKKIKRMLHPIFWMDQGVTLPESTVAPLKEKLIRTQEIVKVGTFSIFTFGCICVFAAFIIFLCRKHSVKQTKYNPKKASLQKSNSAETGDTFLADGKPDWSSQISPLEKYSKITSPPNGHKPAVNNTSNEQQLSPEEQPFLKQNGHKSSTSPPRAIPVSPPVISYTSHPTIERKESSEPQIVGVYPKIPSGARSPEEINATARSNRALGVPFPKQNFSSSNSVNNDLNDIDHTLKDINDTLSSYENLK